MSVVQLRKYQRQTVNETDIIELGNSKSVRKLHQLLFKDKTPATVISKKTKLSPATVSNMRYGITQSPHSRTVSALYGYYGYKTVAFK